MKPATILTLCLGFCCAVAVRAQTPMSADERAVWRTEFDWNKAYLSNDAPKLAEIESESYVFTESDGTVHPRADEIAEAKHAEMHFSEMSLHEASARITGDTAIVTGRLGVTGGPGHEFGEIVEATDTLVRRDGQWRAAASAASQPA